MFPFPSVPLGKVAISVTIDSVHETGKMLHEGIKHTTDACNSQEVLCNTKINLVNSIE